MESSVATATQQSEHLRLGTMLQAPRARGRERSAILARTLASADFLAAMAAATTAVVAFGINLVDAAPFIGAAVVGWPAIAFSVGLYGGDDLRTWVSGISEIPRGSVATLGFSWIVFGAAVALELPNPGGVAAWTLGAVVVASGAGRAAARATLHRIPSMRQRALILGSGVVAGQLVDKLRANDQFGIIPVGIVDEDVHDEGAPDLPHLGSFSDLNEILDRFEIDRVIIAFSRAGHQELLHCIRACRDHGVAVDVVPRLFEFLDGVRALDHVGGLPVLSIGVPRLTRSAQVAKRTFDFVAAALTTVLLAPFLLLIVIAIKLESRGPAFFRQQRAGRDRETFSMIKFRSMRSDADERKYELAEHNESSDGVMFKIREDPRVTRVGRFLRRFSLDELPQLFNILRGQMSFVGPRPLILPETDALTQSWHLRRLELRPGLTGPWQVYGRSQTPFQEMVRFDYQYVAGWSLARDIEILLSTFPAVLSGRGAY